MTEADAAQNLTGALGVLDYVIVAAALAVLLVIAYVTGRKETDTRDFFLGGRHVPAIIACFSFVAAEVSAVTILAVPADGYRSNWQYLQMFLGSATARVVTAFLFIPAFYRLNCTSIYEFLRDRFGRQTQLAGSAFFFITRLLASGVRLYAACMGVAIILGWSLEQALLVFTLVSMAFIAFGGIKAVLWTGAYEAVMFYGAGIAVAIYLILHIDGGLAEVWRVAGAAGSLQIFNLRLSLADPNTLWASFANGFLVGLAIFGADQDFMQRLLSVKTRRSSQLSLLGTIAAALPLTILYVALGTLLFVFYAQHPSVPPPAKSDEILSHFVANWLPVGLKGLVLAAIILASIDSPLSSLSASFVTDIYRPLLRKGASERHYLWVSRLGVVGFAVVLATLALACKPLDQILWVAFKVLAVTGGSTLGVFLLGLLTKRHANRANVVAMVTSAAAMAALLTLCQMGYVALGWTWLIVLGTGLTFVLGWLLGPVLDGPRPGSPPYLRL